MDSISCVGIKGVCHGIGIFCCNSALVYLYDTYGTACCATGNGTIFRMLFAYGVNGKYVGLESCLFLMLVHNLLITLK